MFLVEVGDLENIVCKHRSITRHLDAFAERIAKV